MPPVLFNRWAKSSSFTPSELQVLEKLLPQDSPDSRRLLEQARQAPYVLRKTAGTPGYEAKIPYVANNSLVVEAERDIESPSVEIFDAQSGRRLRFSTVILRGGFLLGLRGVAADGDAWPRKWRIGSEVAQPDEVFRWLDALPSPMNSESASSVFSTLVDWSGADAERISEQQRRYLRFAPPASLVDIADCEARLHTTLPDQYAHFVKISNGFGIQRGRPYELLGTKDVCYLDESRHWIGITPLYEDGYVALRNEDCSATCYLLSPVGPSRIGDLRQHVRESLEWKV